MKKLAYIFSALSAVILLAASCAKETPYEPAPKPTGAQVYFDFDNPKTITLSNKETSFKVALGRQNTEGSVTVAITATGDGAQNLTIPSSVTFAAGASTAELVITYDVEKVGYDNPQAVTLTVADATLTTPYGYDSYSFTANIPAPWIKFAKAHVVEGWWGEEEDETIYYQDLENGMRKCYISDCFDTGGGCIPIDFTFYWNTVTNTIDVPKQYFGCDYDDWTGKPESEATSPIYVYDWYSYFTTDGGYAGSWKDADEFYEKNGASYPRGYYDGNGGFYFNLRYYIPGLGGWTPDKFDMYAICEGFVRKDYNISVQYGGMTVYADGSCYPFINFAAEAADVVNVKWMVTDQNTDPNETLATILEGESEDIQTTAMEATEVEEVTVYGAKVELPLEVGLYRVVAVPQGDEGELSEDHAVYVDFYFSGAKQEVPEVEAQLVLCSASAIYDEETVEYYDLRDWNSFGWAIKGTDIVTAYRYINKADVISSWTGELCDLALAYGKELTSAQLASVNGNGYANASMGLSAETEYGFILYLENKYGATATIYKTRTTSSVPYSGDLKIGDYTVKYSIADEESGQQYDFSSTFNLQPTTTENEFLVTNLGIKDGTSFYAAYDATASTLTLDGTIEGLESYGNLFGQGYGYYDSAKTYIYAFMSAASAESEGTDPCVFKIENNYLSELQTIFAVQVYSAADGSFAGTYSYFGAGSKVTFGAAETSNKKSSFVSAEALDGFKMAGNAKVPYSPFASSAKSLDKSGSYSFGTTAAKTVGEKVDGKLVKGGATSRYAQPDQTPANL